MVSPDACEMSQDAFSGIEAAETSRIERRAARRPGPSGGAKA